MSSYLLPIKAAILLFPLLAAVFTLPYILVQYRRYGALLMLRVAVVYSFILYLMCAYFLTILPLPPVGEVAQYTRPIVQLRPFQFVRDFLAGSGFVPGDVHTWLPAMKASTFYQAVFNVLLRPIVQLRPFQFVRDFLAGSGFVPGDVHTWLPAMKASTFYQAVFNVLLVLPFGVYLHYYFDRGFWSTSLLSFLLSLSFELIQLSALFGMYPRPYRLFDVDDLLLNTIGGVIGWVITPLFCWFLPPRERLDARSYQKKGRRVSYTRRLVALAVDWAGIGGCMLAGALLLRGTGLPTAVVQKPQNLALLYICAVVFYFFFFPWSSGGRTLGKLLVGIKLVGGDGQPPHLGQLALRYSLLYFVLLPAPVLAAALTGVLPNTNGPVQGRRAAAASGAVGTALQPAVLCAVAGPRAGRGAHRGAPQHQRSGAHRPVFTLWGAHRHPHPVHLSRVRRPAHRQRQALLRRAQPHL